MANVTALYAGLCGILIIALAFRVVQFRRTGKVGIGSGGDRSNQIRVRAHANAIEYIPIALILMLIAELGGLSAFWLHIFGGVFVLARLVHAFGFTASGGGYHPGRLWGTVLSWVVILVLAAIDIGLAVKNL